MIKFSRKQTQINRENVLFLGDVENRSSEREMGKSSLASEPRTTEQKWRILRYCGLV